MPTYEYACRACGHTFEVVQSMKDDSLKECPECGGELRKVFAPPMITFRGTGFYATDHRKKAEGSADKDTADASSDKGRGDKDEKGTEKKDSSSSTSDAASKGSPGKRASEKRSSDSERTGSSSSERGSSGNTAPPKKGAPP
jgi:putative FmdB family regulatory protein